MKSITFLTPLLLICVGLLGCKFEEPIGVIEAAATGNVTRLVELIGPAPSLAQTRNGYGESPLIAAIESNQLECAKILLEHKAEINWQNGNGDSPILCAIKKGDPDMVSLLLDYQPDLELVNTSGVSASSYLEKKSDGVDQAILDLVYQHQNGG